MNTYRIDLADGKAKYSGPTWLSNAGTATSNSMGTTSEKLSAGKPVEGDITNDPALAKIFLDPTIVDAAYKAMGAADREALN